MAALFIRFRDRKNTLNIPGDGVPSHLVYKFIGGNRTQLCFQTATGPNWKTRTATTLFGIVNKSAGNHCSVLGEKRNCAAHATPPATRVETRAYPVSAGDPVP